MMVSNRLSAEKTMSVLDVINCVLNIFKALQRAISVFPRCDSRVFQLHKSKLVQFQDYLRHGENSLDFSNQSQVGLEQMVRCRC